VALQGKLRIRYMCMAAAGFIFLPTKYQKKIQEANLGEAKIE
jgi:hypothetical protein